MNDQSFTTIADADLDQINGGVDDKTVTGATRAATGAGIGAVVGSVAGPPGALVGAGVGAAAGWISRLFW